MAPNIAAPATNETRTEGVNPGRANMRGGSTGSTARRSHHTNTAAATRRDEVEADRRGGRPAVLLAGPHRRQQQGRHPGDENAGAKEVEAVGNSFERDA